MGEPTPGPDADASSSRASGGPPGVPAWRDRRSWTRLGAADVRRGDDQLIPLMRVAIDSVRVDRNDDAVTDVGEGAERFSECKRPARK